MTLRLHRAERTAVLADALAEVVATPLGDPFTREVIAVPAKGVERWLTQRLSTSLGAGGSDGVAANIAFPSPNRLVDEAVAAAGGHEADDDPWAPQRVLWTLLDIIDSCVGEPWCSVLAGHLGHGQDGHRAGRRYAAAEHLRDLYRSYSAHRPQLLVDWAAGKDTDGAGGPLDPDQVWQAELWRRLRARLDAPSPAERLEDTCRTLRDDPGCSDLPERLSLFGATRLTTEQRTILRTLSEHRDVHLWLPHPSPALWASLVDEAPVTRRREDRTALLVGHPLLASLSRDTRELQLLLNDMPDTHHPGDQHATSLLQSVQAALRDDAPPTATATADGTLQVHACHGPARQVEVLREALLHLFQQHEDLEPREVLVMCPDVETYAPLVKAAFGQEGAGHPGHRLRVRLADRSLKQTNPLLDTLSGLLALADGRVTASQVLDLAASAPVRRHFRFSDDDLERLREWAARAGVRWALGPRERDAFSLGGVPQNTWRTGLDRLLVGVAADESDLTWLGLALPLDDVDSSDIDLAGRLAELLARLEAVLSRLDRQQPVRDWVAALSDALDLLTEVSEDDAWQVGQARRQLFEAAEHGGDAELRLADLRVLLAGRLAGRPTRANFRTGELTVCTMVPMRSVPHRVIALLGLDDGVFPRGGSVDGDDVLQRDPCLGERDVRSEDRQLLLDALMSAGDHLLLLYTGADPVTGATRPPSVPLGELLDAVRETVGDDELAGVLTRHPLQPFDGRNFLAGKPFSHDTAAYAGARAALRPRTPTPDFLGTPLPPPGREVALRDLVAFVVHPVKALLARRLGVHIPDAQDAVADALAAELDSLQKWDVGDRMLAARLAGVDAAAFQQAEWRRGTLPPGPLGMRLLHELDTAVEPIVQAALPVHAGVARAVDVVLELDGHTLTGTVNGVHGGVLASTSYSSLAPKHRLAAWVHLLALAACSDDAVLAVTTGRGPYKRPVWRSTLTVPEDPAAVLRDLIALYDDGMRQPLPLVTGASAKYAERRRAGDVPEEALEAAAKEWDAMFGDSKDRHVAYVFGSPPQLSRLTTAPGAGDEPTRFGELAVRLWSPLLAHEEVGAP
ncbi:MAG: Exodeoxyribonuclease gamma chain [Frankiales bacterium]|nr:Exodeoxyribonuclease gamma chain [Frankiales bacterium]